MASNKARSIKDDTIALLTRKRAMTYEAMVGEIQKRHPEARTTVKTVQWYASRLRAAGQAVNVKRSSGSERRDWTTRTKNDASHRAAESENEGYTVDAPAPTEAPAIPSTPVPPAANTPAA